jgi:hypothetical protein
MNTLNKCAIWQILNPKTNRCVNKIGKIGKQINNQHTCPHSKILNPKTNRCVDENGKIGKILLNKQSSSRDFELEIRYKFYVQRKPVERSKYAERIIYNYNQLTC